MQRAIKALTITLLLAAPLAAVAFLVTGNPFTAGGTPLVRGDDPLTNGLRIVEPRPSNAAPPAVATERNPVQDDEAVLYLQNWDYTDENGSSLR
jgi:hypothetical protein